MYDLKLTDNQFNPDPCWHTPTSIQEPIVYDHSDLFDQSGYDLSPAEQLFAICNDDRAANHKEHRVAIRQHWITQPYKNSGAVLNHGLMFERKGYADGALEQLREWTRDYPAYFRMINIKPKWGLDFSMDFYDHTGRTFEVLHWEYDGFCYDDIQEMKIKVEPVLVNTDWDDAAEAIYARRDEWYSLDFFSQSEYKCKFFGIVPERYKMLVW